MSCFGEYGTKYRYLTVSTRPGTIGTFSTYSTYMYLSTSKIDNRAFLFARLPKTKLKNKKINSRELKTLRKSMESKSRIFFCSKFRVTSANKIYCGGSYSRLFKYNLRNMCLAIMAPVRPHVTENYEIRPTGEYRRIGLFPTVLRIRIRDPMPLGPLDPGSGMGEKSEPGSGMNNPDHTYFRELRNNFFG